MRSILVVEVDIGADHSQKLKLIDRNRMVRTISCYAKTRPIDIRNRIGHLPRSLKSKIGRNLIYHPNSREDGWLHRRLPEAGIACRASQRIPCSRSQGICRYDFEKTEGSQCRFSQRRLTSGCFPAVFPVVDSGGSGSGPAAPSNPAAHRPLRRHSVAPLRVCFFSRHPSSQQASASLTTPPTLRRQAGPSMRKTLASRSISPFPRTTSPNPVRSVPPQESNALIAQASPNAALRVQVTGPRSARLYQKRTKNRGIKRGCSSNNTAVYDSGRRCDPEGVYSARERRRCRVIALRTTMPVSTPVE